METLTRWSRLWQALNLIRPLIWKWDLMASCTFLNMAMDGLPKILMQVLQELTLMLEIVHRLLNLLHQINLRGYCLLQSILRRMLRIWRRMTLLISGTLVMEQPKKLMSRSLLIPIQPPEILLSQLRQKTVRVLFQKAAQ